MLQNNRDLTEQLGKFKEIALNDYEDEVTHKEYVSMKMTTFTGRKFVINNIDFALPEKFQKMFAVESTLFSKTDDQLEEIKVVKNDKGEYLSYDFAKDLTDESGNKVYEESDFVPLTHSILSDCYIKIDNYTLTEHIERTEKDIFYAMVENV